MAELISGMFTASRYKRSQGRIARQGTFFALVATAWIGAYLLFEHTGSWAAALVIALVGFWAAFRVVNIPSFAEFLISVEAEMNKVSWPSRAEVVRASLVVILVIFLLTAILFTYDLALRAIVKVLLGQ